MVGPFSRSSRITGRIPGLVPGRESVLTPEAKMNLADRIRHSAEPFKAMPVRRVYIPKAGGKRRPLGIPVIVDRVHQARVVNALEPEWEARFEPRSYGFRPGRGCHDAIEAIFHVARGPNPLPPLGARCGSGGGIRPNRSPPAALPSRYLPRQGSGPTMAEGRCGRT